MSNFTQRFASIAERFLQTVVIVDDEPHFGFQEPVPGELETPSRRTTAAARRGQENQAASNRHSLDAGTIVESFAMKGLICGVVAPNSTSDLIDNLASAVRQADIIVLDWQLQNDDGHRALSLVNHIVDDDDDDRLRLISVYTGEQDINQIGREIKAKLEESGREFKFLRERSVTLSRGYCRIEVYAKAGTLVEYELRDRLVEESEVASTLIGDFSNMTLGLLPSIALSALTAVRENAHKVLDKFPSDLDPAFLAHRASLHSPDEASQQLVAQVASELHGIMDDVVARESPVGLEAIGHWLVDRIGGDTTIAFDNNKEMSLDQTTALLREGLERAHGPLSKRSDFKILSRGFAREDVNAEELDRRLAWMMNFRTVFDAPLRVLQLGTVVGKEQSSGEIDFFLCLRPRCDSVRLNEEKTESFLLLPLMEPPQQNTIQLVLRTNEPQIVYPRVSVSTRMTQWQLLKFRPDKTQQSVIAKRDGHCFYFTSSGGVRFEWLGELKAEFAQRIAQHFASGVSRVAVHNSEWLRRSEGSVH